MIKGNKRLEGESFKKYRKRIKKENEEVKSYLRGRWIWIAKSLKDVKGWIIKGFEGKGAYIRKLHGEIGTEKQSRYQRRKN